MYTVPPLCVDQSVQKKHFYLIFKTTINRRCLTFQHTLCLDMPNGGIQFCTKQMSTSIVMLKFQSNFKQISQQLFIAELALC